MDKCLAFVLGGGGARGAMQVGALRALIEADYKPDLLVGTSIGAANATALAMGGADLGGIAALEHIYHKLAVSNIMDPRLSRLAMKALSRQPNHHASRKVADFFIEEGITPNLRFNQIKNVRLALISADLDTGKPVIYGQDPGQSILDGLMASIALPPWFAPVEKDGHIIVDGGAFSNLPIEPALIMGATEIIALDLDNPANIPDSSQGINYLVAKLSFGLSRRHIELETNLAEAQGVPVHFIELKSSEATPIWDFHNYQDLIKTGYEIATHTINQWANQFQEKFVFPELNAKYPSQ
jgi:NTE family protein